MNSEGYMYSQKAMDESLTKYYFRELSNLPWMNFFNLRKAFRYSIGGNNIPIMDEIITTLMAMLESQGIKNRECIGSFVNLYENGSQKTPYHKDSYGADVFTLSLGATRRFRIKRDYDNHSIGFDLEDGDCFFFTEAFNSLWKHSIQPTKKSVGQRISVVLFLKKKK